jgi:hypothetical protein
VSSNIPGLGKRLSKITEKRSFPNYGHHVAIMKWLFHLFFRNGAWLEYGANQHKFNRNYSNFCTTLLSKVIIYALFFKIVFSKDILRIT